MTVRHSKVRHLVKDLAGECRFLVLCYRRTCVHVATDDRLVTIHRCFN